MNLSEQLTSVANQLARRWKALPGGRKAAAVLAVAGVMAAAYYLGGLVLTPRYGVLFSNLKAAEAGTIVGKLQAMKVPYRLANQGTTVEVPDNEVYSVRIQLASDGTLQNAESGWSLFDKNTFGMTDFQEQVDYQRALQDELRNTISQMDGVQDAVVNLVLPPKSDFVESGGTASASVLLKLRPGVTLTPDQVQGVVDLVEGSVQGLKPANIHIVGSTGQILNGHAGQSQAGAADFLNQQKVTEAYDKTLQEKVQSMLDQILGPGEAVAKVSADLDFSQKETTSVQYQPGPKLSEQKSSSSGSGTTAGGGIPTTPQNTTTAPVYQSGSQGTSKYQKNSDTVNYDVSSSKVDTVKAPGTVRRISTSVVVNSAGGQAVTQGQVQAAVAAAIGFDKSRGDQITVQFLPFNKAYATGLAKQMVAAEAQARKQKLIKMAGEGLLAFILLIILAIALLRRRGHVVEYREAEEEAAVEAGQPPQELSEEDRQAFFSMNEKLELIRELAQDKPEEVAEIVKVWIKE